MAILFGGHAAPIERELRGYQFLWAGVPGKNVRQPVEDSVLVQQEMPWHATPAPYFRPGRQGPNVAPRPQVEDTLVTVQEMPRHPAPFLLAARQGPDVANRPQVEDSLVTTQEFPRHPFPLVAGGFIPAVAQPRLSIPVIAQPPAQPDHPRPAFGFVPPGQNVRSPIDDNIVTVQELPGQPPSLLRIGKMGPDVRQPVDDSIAIFQELPAHPGGRFVTGVTGPDVRAPVMDSIAVFQEFPRHPSPYLRVGIVGPDVANGIKNWIATIQESPYHPGPYLRSAPIYTASTVLSPELRLIITQQEFPRHPAPSGWPGIQGPNVASGITNWIATIQEAPGHPGVYFRSAPLYTASVFLTPESRLILSRQELPRHPDPTIRIGVQGPNVRSPRTDTVLVRQETPGHLMPVLLGKGWPNVREPVIDRVLIVQELPGHPLPSLNAGIQAPPTLPQAIANLIAIGPGPAFDLVLPRLIWLPSFVPTPTPPAPPLPPAVPNGRWRAVSDSSVVHMLNNTTDLTPYVGEVGFSLFFDTTFSPGSGVLSLVFTKPSGVVFRGLPVFGGASDIAGYLILQRTFAQYIFRAGDLTEPGLWSVHLEKDAMPISGEGYFIVVSPQ